MKAGEQGRAVPWLALSAAALAWTLSSLPSALQSKLALSHAGLLQGELWRLWTGHFVHFGSAHLRGDLLAFAVWAALIEDASRGVLWRILLLATPLLSLSLLVSCPELAEYRGLSGLDCSLVVALIGLRGLASPKLRGVGLLCLGCFVAKCVYEVVVGSAILAPDLGQGVKLLPLAHVLGAFFGLIVVQLGSRGAPGPAAQYGGAGSSTSEPGPPPAIRWRGAAAVGRWNSCVVLKRRWLGDHWRSLSHRRGPSRWGKATSS